MKLRLRETPKHESYLVCVFSLHPNAENHGDAPDPSSATLLER